MLLVFCAGCPAAERSKPAGIQPGASQTDARPAASGSSEAFKGDPAPAADCLLQCLDQPENAAGVALGSAWLVVAQLQMPETDSAGAGVTPGLEQVRQAVLKQVNAAQGKVTPELAAAWLACAPEQALAYLTAKLKDGDAAYLASLSFRPDTARMALAGLGTAKLNPALANGVLNMLAQWSAPDVRDTELYRALASNADTDARLRASGSLLALGQASPQQQQELETSLRGGNLQTLPAAAEAVKLAGLLEGPATDALASALVQQAAKCALGPENPKVTKDFAVLYAAYAATYLPGEQARLLRKKLLGAADSTVRWQARLGELLHGDASFWDQAVASTGIAAPDLWITLQPPEAWSAELLPTYQQALASKDPDLRLQAARHLNRYRALASNEVLRAMLARLLADPEPTVCAAGWYTCADLKPRGFEQQALDFIADRAHDNAARLAAAYYVLRITQTTGEN